MIFAVSIAFIFVIVFGSVVLHEIAHGAVALWFGDTTARDAGRLTLNPIKHIDPLGTLILPAICILFGLPVFGWAKPVPVNTDALQPRRFGMLCVAMAGIVVNVLIAISCAAIFRLTDVGSMGENLIATILFMVVWINVLLAVFNLLPIPPLDGSRLITTFLPRELSMKIEQRAFFFIIGILLLIPFLPLLTIIKTIVSFLLGITIEL